MLRDSDEWSAAIEGYAVYGKGMFDYNNVLTVMKSRLGMIRAEVTRVKLTAFHGEVKAVDNRASWYTELSASAGLLLPSVPICHRG